MMKNLGDDAVHVLENLDGRNTESFIAGVGEDLIPHCIALGTIAIAVVFAIDLDQQAASETREISHVAGDWILLAELQPVGPGTKNIPEKDFG